MFPEPYDIKMDDKAVEEHQTRLRGIRVRPFFREGCPHRYGVWDSVDCCDANEGRVCVYETFEANQGCETFREILREIEEEMRGDIDG